VYKLLEYKSVERRCEDLDARWMDCMRDRMVKSQGRRRGCFTNRIDLLQSHSPRRSFKRQRFNPGFFVSSAPIDYRYPDSYYCPFPRFIIIITIVARIVVAMALRPIPYTVPTWCQNSLLNHPSSGRFTFANVPTLLYRLVPPSSSDPSPSSPKSIHTIFKEINSTLWIKRDDCTSGGELGGNKIRKLEFLLAEAVQRYQCDAIITIGGVQSNHGRATACAARMLGLEPHLILRKGTARAGRNTDVDDDDDDVGLVGNLLLDRMVGAHIYTCTPGEYGRIGSEALLSRLCSTLQSREGKRPYKIPVGGSNGLGTWGYIRAVDELMGQWNAASPIDHIVVACGSGGTAAGITLGVALAKKETACFARTMVHAIGVCDDEEYFYNHISNIAIEMGLVTPIDNCATVPEYIRRHLIMHQGKGLGYAQSTREEYDFIVQFAKDTGIVLDPVYTGKALFNFVREVERKPQQYGNQNILFWHTGGFLGLFDKSNDLMDKLQIHSPCQRLDVYGKGDDEDL
jgi:D-cysteine desulfhydrase